MGSPVSVTVANLVMEDIEQRFTIETEVEGTLPFLETRATRHTDGSFTTSVFRKKTHTDRYLDFDSHHPLAHKIAVARTLFTRADRICMSMPDRDAEKRHITQVLYSNEYPTRLVKRYWQTPLAHSPASESIQLIFTLLEIRTCFRLHRTLWQTWVNLKDHIALQQQAGVVYRIICGTCPKVYVG